MIGLDVLYNDHQKKNFPFDHGRGDGRPMMKKSDFFEVFYYFFGSPFLTKSVHTRFYGLKLSG